MVARLTLGILSVVFLPLGVVFLVIGLVVDEPDSGDPAAFVYVGAGLGLVGLVCAVAFVVLWRKEAARRRRRRDGLRARVEVVRADVNWGVRVNGRPAVSLTVRGPGGDVSGTFLAGPALDLTPGQSIDILYDPLEPSNFEPVR
jgi:hypothetical protein